jgi:uncharacterized protein YneF (UPF0154 family)
MAIVKPPERTQATTRRKPLQAAFTIGGALALGALVVWIVTLDWMIDIMAEVFLVGVMAAGFFTARAVHKRLDGIDLFRWERMAIAVILGISVTLALGGLIQSHKLVNSLRDNPHYDND